MGLSVVGVVGSEGAAADRVIGSDVVGRRGKVSQLACREFGTVNRVSRVRFKHHVRRMSRQHVATAQ